MGGGMLRHKCEQFGDIRWGKKVFPELDVQEGGFRFYFKRHGR
jgi:putative component of toxin-antitoxin plasmid stabilization module